jgi:DNA-binding transcriptional MocR family regulator
MTIWKPEIQSSTDPIYVTIANAIEADVNTGRLKPGDRLPTHRELALALGVSIGTVTRAYAIALRRGIIRGETGRGTYIQKPAGNRQSSHLELRAQPGLIDLSINFPITAEDPDLQSALRKLARRSDLQPLLRYLAPDSERRCLSAGARWMESFGVRTDAESLLMTNGSQHAISLICSTVANPGDLLFADALTYPGLISAAHLHGLRLQGIAGDEIGMIPDALDAACRKRSSRLLYLLPTVHNPLTSVLTGQRRRELAAVAKKHDLWIIEDDIHRPLVTDPPPPIYEIAPERTFYIASIGKAIVGGLRIAFVAAPRQASEKLRHGIACSVMLVPHITAELLTQWFEDGTAAEVTERKRVEAGKRQALATELLAQFSFRSHPASYIIWLELFSPWSGSEFAFELRRKGVAVAPGETFAAPGQQAPNAVRICLGAAADRAELHGALTTIANLLRTGRQSSAPMM